MKRKKLTLNKLTLGYLTDVEQKGIVGGAASNVYVNTECATPITYPKTSYLATCPPEVVTKGSCKTAPYATCSSH
jgi:hypothetical protein